MRVLVVGASGLLGSNVLTDARARGWEATGTVYSTPVAVDENLPELDVRDTERFEQLLETVEPDAVVNCAALTSVDQCERAPETAHAINGDAPGVLARECAVRDLPFIHISTDYVFDGTASVPYRETAAPNPKQVYGESKLAGENAVRYEHDNALVVRTSFVYGTHGLTGGLEGFAGWVRQGIRMNEALPLFTDQWVTPTRAGQLATAVLELLVAGETGTVHVTSRSCVTPYEFAATIGERLSAPAALFEEHSLVEDDRPAPRPQYSCLSVNTVEAILGRRQPTIDADLNALTGALSESS